MAKRKSSNGRVHPEAVRHALSLARSKAPDAVRTLLALMSSGTPAVRLKAAMALLDRGVGTVIPTVIEAEETAAAMDQASTAERVHMLEYALKTEQKRLKSEREHAIAHAVTSTDTIQ